MSYKRKNIILLIAVVLLLWVSWKMAIGETVQLQEKVSFANEELKKVENAPDEIYKLEQQLEQVKGKTSKLYSGILEMRKELLTDLTMLTAKYDLSLRSFPDYYLQRKEDFELTTSPIVVSGSFAGMVQMIYDFEQNNRTGKISSALFKVKESPRTKKRELYLTLYIQSINL